MKSHYQILIIGGGTAGIMTAAQLIRSDKNLDIAIIEPADTHYYQPAWTLVGAGTYDFKKTARPMKDLIPKGVGWIKDFATGFEPKENSIHTENHGSIGYDYLVVAPGLITESVRSAANRSSTSKPAPPRSTSATVTTTSAAKFVDPTTNTKMNTTTADNVPPEG